MARCYRCDERPSAPAAGPVESPGADTSGVSVFSSPPEQRDFLQDSATIPIHNAPPPTPTPGVNVPNHINAQQNEFI